MTITSYCCDTFQSQVEYKCTQHPTICPDQAVIKSKTHGFLLQAPNATYGIRYCPWCGALLVKSRSTHFDAAKAIREEIGASLKDCLDALKRFDGDEAKAATYLRTRGQA